MEVGYPYEVKQFGGEVLETIEGAGERSSRGRKRVPTMLRKREIGMFRAFSRPLRVKNPVQIAMMAEIDGRNVRQRHFDGDGPTSSWGIELAAPSWHPWTCFFGHEMARNHAEMPFSGHDQPHSAP